MDKRGLSAIVTVLIIILLALVAIAIVWVVVKNILGEQSEISEIQTDFFKEEVEIKDVKINPNNQLNINFSLQKLGGTITSETFEIISPPMKSDVASVADVSGSMRECHGITSECCDSLGGDGSECHGIDSDKIDECTEVCGGTLVDALTTSQEANKDLVDNLFEDPEDNNFMCLSAYNSNVVESYSSDLIDDDETLKNIIDLWEADGGTCICCGINDAANKLSTSPGERPKSMIVMSDGVANRDCAEQGTGSGKLDAIQAACDANSTVPNLTIYSVGLGEGVDEETLQAIAECGDGKYYAAAEIDDLLEIYETIADEIIKTHESVNRVAYLKIVFYDDTGDSTIRNVDAPKPLETKKHSFDLSSDLSGSIVKIEVYPVIKSESGKEVVGEALDVWEA